MTVNEKGEDSGELVPIRSVGLCTSTAWEKAILPEIQQSATVYGPRVENQIDK